MKNRERGQAIILIAVVMVALMAVIGLALDGGRLYQSRRQAQNAADAAALAGARLLLSETCEPSHNSDLEISNAIIDFAGQNGVVWDGSNIRAHYVKIDGNTGALTAVNTRAEATGISVTLELTNATTFLRVVGIRDMMTPASAVALAGPVTQIPAGSAVLPVAVPDEVLYQMNEGDYMTIVNDAVCRNFNPQNCIEDPDASYSNANSQRGWLNFGYIYNYERYQQDNPTRRTHRINLNANELKAVIEVAAGMSPNNPPWWLGNPPRIPPIFMGTPPNPWPDLDGNSVYYLDGDYILGGTGQKQVGMSNIFDFLRGQTAYLPVFDRVYPVSYLINTTSVYPTPYVEDNSGPWPNPNSSNDYFYHIIGFAAVRLPDPPPSGNPKELEGTLLQVIIGEGEIDPTQPLQCDLRAHGVILWK